MTAAHGVLVIDEPQGKTSHDIVAEARRLFGTRAVGHAGTLDPMATGVLLLLLGEATKLSPFLSASDKRYLAEISLGRSTDSFDADGQTSEERPVARLSPSAVEQALAVTERAVHQHDWRSSALVDVGSPGRSAGIVSSRHLSPCWTPTVMPWPPGVHAGR